MSHKPQKNHTLAIVILILLIIAMIAATGFVIWLCIDMVNVESETTVPENTSIVLPTAETTPPTTMETEPAETTVPPEPEHVVATATISSQGDLLMHKPVFDTCRQSDGSYDFSSLFKYLKDTVSAFDYAAANLETTFGGDDYPYQGNPTFNCPDPLANYLVDAGFDMLMTANNHCSDTTAYGVKRTLEVVRGVGLDTVGTQRDAEEKKYTIAEVNGIKIGMICYTYATDVTSDGRPALNGLLPVAEVGLVNYFMNNNPGKMYEEVEQILMEMEAAGAEASMMFIHWGVEYQTTENATQNAIAQKLCDLGIDVIVGGHPHVVQPVELLESTVDPEHRTVCIYSLGNAVSNQRTGISNLFPAGYTEDGALFTVTFEKYSDGSVYLAGTDVLPTWVNMHQNNGPKEYNILPLDKEKEDQWQEMFQLTDHNFSSCQKSYDRTMGIVGEGLAACQEYLAKEKIDREQYYYDLAFFPERFVEETVAETVAETYAEETTLPAA